MKRSRAEGSLESDSDDDVVVQRKKGSVAKLYDDDFSEPEDSASPKPCTQNHRDDAVISKVNAASSIVQ
jgi:hypothetical protein